MASPQQGVTLGEYRIIEQIGMGGMATVYKAYQPGMDRMVALKVLPQQYSKDKKFIERFEREARTIARLEHRNILPVYGYGQDQGVTYMAMRYLEGGTLRDVLDQGRLTLGDIVSVIEQVCAGLDYAHRQGVVHRDVKPSNVMVDDEGWAYVTDFGIARVLDASSELTGGGAIGTPAYMAPEQSMGKKVDHRADIYAMGIILYELVVGRVPYQAETPMAVALAHVHSPLPLPRSIDPRVPEAVEKVILKALAKEPEHRYDSANQLAADFKAAVAQSSVDSTSTRLKALAQEAHASQIHEAVTVDTPASLFGGLAAARPAAATSRARRMPGWLLPAVGVALVVVIGIAVVLLLGLNQLNNVNADTTPSVTPSITPLVSEPSTESVPVNTAPQILAVDLSYTRTSSELQIYQYIKYQDADGDAYYVDYTLVSATVAVDIADGDISDSIQVQKTGGLITGLWHCGGQNYEISLSVVILDHAGNRSNSYPYSMVCN
jgi:serine/threonine protein kinase